MMKRVKSAYITIALFALAATLLTFSAVGSSRAALTYFSETYGAEVSMYDIGVTLRENGKAVSSRDYSGRDDVWRTTEGELVGYIGEDELVLGKKYDEVLDVKNSGQIDHYMRVTIRRYWEENGEKRTDLDPSLIDLHLTNLGTSWYQDGGWTAEEPERTVLYYTGGQGGVLEAGATSEPFADTLTIKGEPILADIEAETTTTNPDGSVTIETKYTYNGLDFVLQVDVDAVQTHNSAEAIRSAWGVEMTAKGMTPVDD